MKDKRGIINNNTFQKALKESNCKGEFYNRSLKPWLEKNYIEIYSTHNERNSAVFEIFVRAFKNKIYKYLTSISKNVFIDKLDDIVNKYNIEIFESRIKSEEIVGTFYKKELQKTYPK